MIGGFVIGVSQQMISQLFKDTNLNSRSGYRILGVLKSNLSSAVVIEQI